MKPYFAKYLPVDGKPINNTDIVIGERGTIMTYFAYKALGGSGSIKKAKLFLCSRDIQVGDNYQSPKRFGSKEYIDAYCDGDFFPGSFKVFGEISTEATWVKEGDEFNEDEWRYWNSTIGGGVFVDKAVVASIKTDTIKIKGPCGYFH